MASAKIKNKYDYIIIGGGIVGAGILRDLTLHKQDVLLIEKGDFSSQTSGGSSKMLHGGIRYLENFDFALVFEALREKKIWLNLASHISKEQIFYLPVYKESKWPLFLMRIGLFIYDLLSMFKNKPYRVINAKQTLKEIKGINNNGLKGAGVYSDGVIDDSKLVFDLIFDSIYHGGSALNYHEAIEYKKENNRNLIKIRNNNSNEYYNIECKHLIFAVGPFTDILLNKLKIRWKNIILPSKGSHIWLDKESLQLKESLVIQTKDGRVIFVIPQRNSILVGTTEIILDANAKLDNLSISKEEIDYLLESINNYFPQSQVTQEHIISSYSAVRPLVKKKAGNLSNSSKVSRHHKIYQPEENVHVIAGGKYTTFRVMASDIVKNIFKAEGIQYKHKLSKQAFTKKSLLSDIHSQKITKELLTEIINKEQVHNLEDLIKRRLSLYSLDQSKNKQELEALIHEVKNDIKNQY